MRFVHGGIRPIKVKPGSIQEWYWADTRYMAIPRINHRHMFPGGFFHLEEEKTKTRIRGYGHGDNIKLKDEYGNVWVGSAEPAEGNTVIYRFRDGLGRSLSGISDNLAVVLRDDLGRTWKGFVD